MVDDDDDDDDGEEATVHRADELGKELNASMMEVAQDNSYITY